MKYNIDFTDEDYEHIINAMVHEWIVEHVIDNQPELLEQAKQAVKEQLLIDTQTDMIT